MSLQKEEQDYSTLELDMCLNIYKRMAEIDVIENINKLSEMSGNRRAFFRERLQLKLANAWVIVEERYSKPRLRYNRKKMREYILSMRLIKKILDSDLGIGRIIG